MVQGPYTRESQESETHQNGLINHEWTRMNSNSNRPNSGFTGINTIVSMSKSDHHVLSFPHSCIFVSIRGSISLM